MNKLINDPRQAVREMLEGVVALSPGLTLLDSENVVVRADLPPPAQDSVAVLSGGLVDLHLAQQSLSPPLA